MVQRAVTKKTNNRFPPSWTLISNWGKHKVSPKFIVCPVVVLVMVKWRQNRLLVYSIYGIGRSLKIRNLYHGVWTWFGSNYIMGRIYALRWARQIWENLERNKERKNNKIIIVIIQIRGNEIWSYMVSIRKYSTMQTNEEISPDF
jgi:hypothetical protein